MLVTASLLNINLNKLLNFDPLTRFALRRQPGRQCRGIQAGAHFAGSFAEKVIAALQELERGQSNVHDENLKMRKEMETMKEDLMRHMRTVTSVSPQHPISGLASTAACSAPSRNSVNVQAGLPEETKQLISTMESSIVDLNKRLTKAEDEINHVCPEGMPAFGSVALTASDWLQAGAPLYEVDKCIFYVAFRLYAAQARTRQKARPPNCHGPL